MNNVLENPDMVLKFNDRYNSFKDFYLGQKQEIYLKLVDLFKELHITQKEKVSLQIRAYVSGFDFSSDFIYGLEDKEKLIDTFLPYFESIEEYEMCSQIREIYTSLNQAEVHLP